MSIFRRQLRGGSRGISVQVKVKVYLVGEKITERPFNSELVHSSFHCSLRLGALLRPQRTQDKALRKYSDNQFGEEEEILVRARPGWG